MISSFVDHIHRIEPSFDVVELGAQLLKDFLESSSIVLDAVFMILDALTDSVLTLNHRIQGECENVQLGPQSP